MMAEQEKEDFLRNPALLNFENNDEVSLAMTGIANISITPFRLID